MSKKSSSVSNFDEEENDLVDLDKVPTFGKKQRDMTMLSGAKRRTRSSLSDAQGFGGRRKATDQQSRDKSELGESGNMLNTSVFNGTNDEYKIEPGTQEDIEVLQLLKIPGYGSKTDVDGSGEQDINREMGALADKEAMDKLVEELMGQNSQFIVDIGN